MPYVCMTEDVANILHTLSFGVYDPVGSTSTIFEEDSPATLLRKTVLYQLGGLKREPRHRGNIRYPRLNVACYGADKLDALEKATLIADALNGKTFDRPKARYYFDLAGEPAPVKVSKDTATSAVNFIVRQVVK